MLVTKQHRALVAISSALVIWLIAAEAMNGLDESSRLTEFVEPPSIELPEREEPPIELQPLTHCNLPLLWGSSWELWVQLDHAAYVLGADGSAEWAEMGMRDRTFRLQRDQLAAIGAMSGASCDASDSPDDAATYVATITVADKSQTIEIPPRSRAGRMLERFGHELEARYLRQRRAAFGHVAAELTAVGSGAWNPRTARYRIHIADETIMIMRGRDTIASCKVDPADIVDFVEWTRTDPEEENFARGTLVAGHVRRTIGLASLGADFAIASIVGHVISMNNDYGYSHDDACREEQLIRETFDMRHALH